MYVTQCVDEVKVEQIEVETGARDNTGGAAAKGCREHLTNYGNFFIYPNEK